MKQVNVEQTSSDNSPQVNQSQQEYPSSSPSSPTRKTLIVAGVLLGFVLFGVGGYLLGVQRGRKTSKEERTVSSQSPTTVLSSTLSTTPANQSGTTTWKPSTELFTITVPDTWKVTQGDGGAGSVDSIVSPDYGKLGTGSILEIKFGPLSGSYPDNLTQEQVTVGNKDATKMVDGNTVYYLVKGVYSPTKDWELNILIVFNKDAQDIATVTEMVDSLVFEPSSEELRSAKTIP